MQFPPPLIPGDPIAVVAPSGPFEEKRLKAGLARLGEFDLHVPSELLGRRDGFFAGTAKARLLELQAALDSEVVKAILVARGGYGIGPLLPLLKWDHFRRFPKWFVGFSDATALHAQLNGQGFGSIHGPNGTTLSTATPSDLEELLQLLLRRGGATHNRLECVTAGNASGLLTGGNLTVLFTEAASGRLKFPEGAIVFLEDVTETSYRIDRMLAALLDGGHFDNVAGFVLGDFTNCSAGRFGVSPEEVLRSRLGSLGIPVVTGLTCGHGERNRPLLFGALAALDGNSCELRINMSSQGS